jgi:maleylacetoacetate isomerase
LNLKNVDYEYRPVDLGAKSQQFSEDYKSMNPMQQVPALAFQKDGKTHTLIQSMAILELLEELYPQPALLPKDPIQRAYVRAVAETIASGIQPLQNLESLHLAHQTDKQFTDFAHLVITKKFPALEALLNKYSGDFSVGNELSFADLLLVPQVYNARRYKVDLTPFPTIRRLTDKLEQIPAFVKALPEKQPDCRV